MRPALVISLVAGTCLSAQVRPSPDDIAVTVDGKPFTTFHAGTEANKPYLAPLRSASGKIITRHFPMENIPGESRDHLHHRGMWFSYDDVNGVKFWENDPSYTKGRIGRQLVRDAKWKPNSDGGTIKASIEWRESGGELLIVESREMVFHGGPNLRTIDFRSTLKAAEDVTFGDTKEGAFAIRLAESFTAKNGCKMIDADGRTGMKNIWGKRSNWVDYMADVDGEKIGVAMFDSPKNPRHPTYWHARDYGLFALNPFGQQAFDKNAEESHWKLSKGDKIEFRWLVAIHAGDADIAGMYAKFAAGR